MHFVFFMLSGNEFHTAGAAYLKALVPSVLVLVIGSFSKFFLFDLSTLQLFWTSKRSTRYFGASPLRHLYVNNAILKSILCATGNQCRDLRRGFTWSYLWPPITTRAAQFWIFCNLSSRCFAHQKEAQFKL